MSDHQKLAHIYRQFITGFAALDRAFRPVEKSEINGIVRIHWPAEGRRGSTWTDEFFAWESDPAVTLAAVQSCMPGPRHYLTDASASGPSNRAFFEANGYVFEDFEPLMTLALAGRPRPDSGHTVSSITDLELANRLTAAQHAAGSSPRPTSQTQIDDPTIVLKIALAGDEPAAAGKGVLVEDAFYISDITTLPSHRKQGYAAAIMEALHADAESLGARFAVLCASGMAANLYRTLGYQDRATVDLYLPTNAAEPNETIIV